MEGNGETRSRMSDAAPIVAGVVSVLVSLVSLFMVWQVAQTIITNVAG